MPGSDVVLLPFPLLLLLVSLFVYICLFVYVSFVFAPVSSWRLLALLMGKLSSLLICGGWLRMRWSWLCLRSPTWLQSGTVYLLKHSPGTFHLLEKVKTPSHSWFYLAVINYSDSKYVCYVYLKLKLRYLFIITASKLPKFEFWRTFSLVMAIVSKQKTSEKVRKNSNFGSLDAVMMNK